ISKAAQSTGSLVAASSARKSLALELVENESCLAAFHGDTACPSAQSNVHGHYLECVWGKVIRVQCPTGTVCQSAQDSTNGLTMCDRAKGVF
ncbi:hypothetical protein GGI02_004918, partial [Coemansia sp. RSA 2322]